jgi:hypothetical protein
MKLWSNPPFWKMTWRICASATSGAIWRTEIQSAQDALAATNKIAGTVLDLRFADGDDVDGGGGGGGIVCWQKNCRWRFLVNAETRGAADEPGGGFARGPRRVWFLAAQRQKR